MRRLLVLRPEPGASATANRARELGLHAVSMPLFEIEPIKWESPGAARFDGLLITSANAVRYAGSQLRDLRGLCSYAVGEATAEALRNAGFDVAATGDDGVDRLLGSLEPSLKLLHLRGEHRREPADARQQITTVAVYSAKDIESPDLNGTAGDAALIHSPRAGRRFAELVHDRGSIAVAAISAAAAHAVGSGWESVEAAPEPTDDALLALAARLCNIPPPE
jgi:uroporphyrinogen-III synthase